MDTAKIGQFIAALRRERGLTQEQLGEKIGVTNKTVSRWETGVYLPPTDALMLLSEEFGVSINEILSGKRLSDAGYRQAAEENLLHAVAASCFSLKERTEFFRRKWLKEHAAAMCCCGAAVIGIFVAGIAMEDMLLTSASSVAFIAAHCWRNNAMMAYVEHKLYD